MKYLMSFLPCSAFVLLLGFLLTGCMERPHKPNPQYLEYLSRVDSAIVHHPEYEAAHLRGIEELKTRLAQTQDPAVRNYLLTRIYEDYLYYDNDSAFSYLKAAEAYVNHDHDVLQYNEYHLNMAGLYVQECMSDYAWQELALCDTLHANRDFMGRYCSEIITLQVLEARIKGVDLANETQVLTQNSIRHFAQVAAPGTNSYAWALYWTYQGADRKEKLIQTITSVIDKTKDSHSRDIGTFYQLLAFVYNDSGDHDKYIATLCDAVQAQIENNDYQVFGILSLISELSKDEAYAEYAYRLFNYLFSARPYYLDRAHSLQMTSNLKTVIQQMEQRDAKEREYRNQVILGETVGVVLLLLLLVALIYMAYRQARLRKAKVRVNHNLQQKINELRDAQQKLEQEHAQREEVISQLAEANAELKSANFIKEKYVGYMFSVCANSIGRMDDFRKNLHRLLKVNKASEALQLTDPESNFVDDQVKDLMQAFDETFLSIYPHFIEDFNALLQPEKHYDSSSDALPTDLRIYALVWLGIDSSTRIAELLHLSNQTVYNARAKMRARALQQPIDTETFVAQVQALGRNKAASPQE